MIATASAANVAKPVIANVAKPVIASVATALAPTSIMDRRTVPAESVVAAPLRFARTTGVASAPASSPMDVGDAVNAELLD